ncbi:MAG: hypothetical protein WCI63_03535 [bacterium]
MGVEQGGLTPEESANFKAKGREQLVTEEGSDYGRAENTAAIQAHAEEENADYDALEKVKKGDKAGLGELSGGYAYIKKVAKEETLDAAGEYANTAQKTITDSRGVNQIESFDVAEKAVGTEYVPQFFGHSEERDKTNESIAKTQDGMNEIIEERNKRQDEARNG